MYVCSISELNESDKLTHKARFSKSNNEETYEAERNKIKLEIKKENSINKRYVV